MAFQDQIVEVHATIIHTSKFCKGMDHPDKPGDDKHLLRVMTNYFASGNDQLYSG
jgi:hypothetical protein